MATANPFDLLGDDDAEDPSLLIAAQKQKLEPKKSASQSEAAEAKPQSKAPSQAKLPSKPLPPEQAVKEARSESSRGGRGGRHGYGRGRGRGAAGGSYRDSSQTENIYGDRDIAPPQGASTEADRERSYERRGGYSGPRGNFRGGRRGGFSGNGELVEGDQDRPHRPFERRSGTGRGNEIKREGSGRGNWGSQNDEVSQVVDNIVDEDDKNQSTEKPSEKPAAEAVVGTDGDRETVKDGAKEKEADKEMTLEEYEKVREEKRKALQAPKTEERKVDVKEFETMQPLSNKKTGDHIFIKLGSEKDRKKELAEKDEKAKKSVSINEFLKPGEGEKYYNPSGGRGRGRGRGPRGGYGGAVGTSNLQAPSIEDPGEFPSLGGK